MALKEKLTKKVGPLPVWGWSLIIATAIGLVIWYHDKQAAAASLQQVPDNTSTTDLASAALAGQIGAAYDAANEMGELNSTNATLANNIGSATTALNANTAADTSNTNATIGNTLATGSNTHATERNTTEVKSTNHPVHSTSKARLTSGGLTVAQHAAEHARKLAENKRLAAEGKPLVGKKTTTVAVPRHTATTKTAAPPRNVPKQKLTSGGLTYAQHVAEHKRKVARNKIRAAEGKPLIGKKKK